MRVGSLCTGIAGLELGLQYAGIETKPVFVSDIDPGACTWLAANMPHTPNLGDFTAYDELPDCDILTAGFPCQPVSTAGKRQGIYDEQGRWIFNDICRLVSAMETKPILWLENVPGILTANSGDAMGRVVYGLADIGYHITWGTLPASAVGAPHRRIRWWGLAYSADADGATIWQQQKPQSERAISTVAGFHQSTAADSASPERRGPQQQDLPSPTGPASEPGERARSLTERFGLYAGAISRWECVLGRTAPDPSVDGRLNPPFVEWMMGYPEGWVTDTLTSRNQALKALGNAVVPQCAAEAFTQLHNRMTHETT